MPDQSKLLPSTVRNAPSKGIIAGIMIALFAWGLYLAYGAYQAAVVQHTMAPALRGLVVFGCSLLFLAFWGAMLLTRRRVTHSG